MHIEGVVALLLTPFHENGAIDWTAYEAYVEWQIVHRPHGVFAVCGSSEMKWLDLEERLELARRAVARSAGIPVIATANLNHDITSHADEIKRMADTGVDAVVLVPPPPISSDPGKYRHYLLERITHAPCPVILYEWPLAPNYLMDPALFAELAPFIAGIKDTTCTLEGIRAKQQVAQNAVVYQANHPFMLDALQIGVRGIMAISSTVRVDWLLQLWHGFAADSDMRALHRELVILDSILGVGYPASAKYLALRQGLSMRTQTRAPSKLDAAAFKALDIWFDSNQNQN